MSVQHKNAALTKRHPVHNWEYANRTARLAAGGFSSGDVGKLAIQTDDMSVWMLKDDSPATWTQVLTLDSPGSGDDGKYLKYIHASRSYALDTPSGGGGGGGGGAPEGIGFDSWVAPGVVADYTQVNIGADEVLTDTPEGYIQIRENWSGGDAWRMLVKTLPSTPYTITIAYQFMAWGVNYSSLGIVLRDSASGKIVHYGHGCEGKWAFRSTRWNNPNSYNSNGLASDNHIPVGAPINWVRVTDDGTNRKMFVSYDGVNWYQLLSESHSSFLTADQYGFGVNFNNSVNTGLFKVLSFEIS